MDIVINEEELIAQLRPFVEARAQVALAGWEAWPRKQDAPEYPFDAPKNPTPDLDVTLVAGGYLLTIRGPQVRFFETGNGDALIVPRRVRYLSIQLRDGGYVELTKVNPYEGERPWEKSVVAAFAAL